MGIKRVIRQGLQKNITILIQKLIRERVTRKKHKRKKKKKKDAPRSKTISQIKKTLVHKDSKQKLRKKKN